MPRVMGLNLVAVLAGAVAMYFIGFLIYGLLFQEVWTQQNLVNHGLLAADEASTLTGDALLARSAEIPAHMDTGLAMGLGFVVSLVTACGMAAILNFLKPASMGAALGRAAVLWIGFAVTTLAYNVVYSSESPVLFGIDTMHLLLGYLAGAAVIYAIDGKAIRGDAAIAEAAA